MKAAVYICGITVLVLSMIVTTVAVVGSIDYRDTTYTIELGDDVVQGDESGKYTIFAADNSTSLFSDVDVQKVWKEDNSFTYKLRIASLGDVTDNLLTGNNMILSQTDFTEDMMWSGTYNIRTGRIGTSPLVVIGRKDVVAALNNQGLVQSLDGRVRYLNMANLVQLMLRDTTWSDIGVHSFSGDVRISSTNPLEVSNGLSYATIILNSLKNGEVKVDDIKWYEDDLMKLLAPSLEADCTSRELFDEFIEGEHPLIVVPENMLIEYANLNVGTWKANADDIVLLYPLPTVWTDYTIIATKATKDSVMDAFYNYEVGKLLWQEYGIRSSTTWVEELTQVMTALGITPEVIQGQDYPGYGVLKTLHSTLKKQHEKGGE